MLKREILEIPIYRLSPDDFWSETEGIKQRYVTPDPEMNIETGFWDSLSEDQKADQIASWTDFFNRSDEARGWKYNDIIGYISIRAGLNQIKAEYWFIDAKRIRRNLKRKIFKYHNKAFEVWVLTSDDSESVMTQVREALDRLIDSWPFKGRHIYLDAFDNVAPYIDWKAITSST